MLSSLNLLSTLSEKLMNQQEGIQNKVGSLLDAIDAEANFLTITYPDDHETYLPYEEFSILEQALEAFKGNTVIFVDGYLMYLIDEQIQQDNYTIHRYYDALHDDALCVTTIVEDSQGGHTPEIFQIQFNGWDPAHHGTKKDELNYPFLGYLTASSLSNTLLIAIDLCSKGMLTPSNFKSAIEASGTAIKNEVSQAVDTIISRVSGTTPFEQASGLVPALQDVLASARADNISVTDEGNIDFHTTEFSIGASILMDVGTVLQAAAGVVTAIVSYFAPVFGAVFSVVSTAMAGLYQYLNSEIGNDWKINRTEDVDNSCYATPLISGSFSLTSLPNLTWKIKSYTKKYGYLRSENAFFTMYSWCDKNAPNNICIELFPNVNVNYRRYWDVGDNQLVTNILNAVNFSTRTYTGVAPEAEHTNITYWFNGEGNTFSPADINQVQNPPSAMSAFDNYQNRWCSWTYLYHFAFMAYRILYRYYGQGSSHISCTLGPEDAWYTASHYDFGEANEITCLEYLHHFLMFCYNESRTSDPQIPPVISSWISLGDNWNEVVYGCVACLYKAMLRLKTINSVKYGSGLLNDIFIMFSDAIDMADDSNIRDLRGLGWKWSCSPFFNYSTNFLAEPPKEKYSIATKLFATGAVVVATAVVTLGINAAVKKKVAWKAENRRQELDVLKKQYQSTRSYSDWNAWRKASNKYNRTFGLLTGTRYDMANAWYNETKTIEGTAPSSDALQDIFTQTNDGKLALDLHEVTDLIYKPNL